MAPSNNAEYTLYSSPFSLYSCMARHTIYLGPTTENAAPPEKITLSSTNRELFLNITESYLKINPKGQVPSLTGNLLEQPITESKLISLHLAENHYPAMLPEQHAAVIRNLLDKIHSILGLSFSKKPTSVDHEQQNPCPEAEDLLKRTDLTAEYRKALEAKLEFHNKNNGVAFRPEVVAQAHEDLKFIFAEVLRHRQQSGASEADWTFGARVGPTVLDSHLLPVVLRCIHAGNEKLVPEELQKWAGIKAQEATWIKVLNGRRTLWDPSMGPVADMKELATL